jgi:outer membrane protein assembly factor BamB
VSASSIELVAESRGVGGPAAMLVGPGAQAGSERLYVSFVYGDSGFELVSIDPATGASSVLGQPVAEAAVSAMILARDGNIYLGTSPHAHLLKLDPHTGRVTDLGRPASSENVIWQLTEASDGKVYGGTWPGAKLVQLDPATGTLADLGRMDPVEEYLRFVAASDDGFVYAGIGASRMKVVAYDIRARKLKQLLPRDLQTPGFGEVYKGTNGKLYAAAGARYFELRDSELRSIAMSAAGIRPVTQTTDGQVLSIRDGKLVATDARGHVVERTLEYAGKDIPIFRLGSGPNGTIYASTLMPARLIRVNERRFDVSVVGELGSGEVYSLLTDRMRLLLAGYSTRAPLMKLDPEAPIQDESNPLQVRFSGADPGWRPMAMVRTLDRVFVGAIAGYGKLDGLFCEWDPDAGTVTVLNDGIVDQSISSLAIRDDLVLVGTSITGGTGSHTTAARAQLFEWNPKSRTRQRSLELPVDRIDSLVVHNDQIYALAERSLIAVDGSSFAIVGRTETPARNPRLWQSIAVDDDGVLWGLADEGIFTVRPRDLSVRIAARTPKPVTAGFAMRDRTIFFASGSKIYRYTLPPRDARNE